MELIEIYEEEKIVGYVYQPEICFNPESMYLFIKLKPVSNILWTS